MTAWHVVRYGALGHVGRFPALDAVRYPRASRVVLRTPRGLELGEVLAPAHDDGYPAEGAIVRGLTVEDQLLAARLEKHRLEALEACEARLRAAALPVVLIDAELLFDGQSLVFYFLGEVPEDFPLSTELADVFDAQVQFRAFAAAVEQGCGPGCGTEQAEGHGCGSCTTGCAVAAACAPRRAAS